MLRDVSFGFYKQICLGEEWSFFCLMVFMDADIWKVFNIV